MNEAEKPGSVQMKELTMNTLHSKNDNFLESNARGSDRFLSASVGTTPGTHSFFDGGNHHRRARRALRSNFGRRDQRAH